VAVHFLAEVTGFVLAIARDPQVLNGTAALHPLLSDSICRFLGSTTFLLADDSGDTGRFVSSLEFLFDAFRSHDGAVRSSAGKSMHQVSRSSLRVGVGLLFSLLTPRIFHSSVFEEAIYYGTPEL
jgi:hypothetical protein